jgi:hypothetical protein
MIITNMRDAVTVLERREICMSQNDDTISRQVVVDTVHKTILGFFSDKDGAMTDTEKTLLSVNKAICDGVRALPSAQPEYWPVTAEDFAKTMSENTLYGYMAWHGEAITLMNEMGFVICKKTM